uniref:Formamidopyrimidine-DNA glycosylase catalytic domain-containing protein n=1 Tax=viral metagenome TaxID=1070528 RepID=A0A6C0LUQ6_9ZZZZ
MPEGPEYRLTIDYLNNTMVGKKVDNWLFCGGNYTETDPEGFDEFDSVRRLLVKKVECKGLFIYFTLIDDKEKEYYILHSLNMTGRWQNNHDIYCKWFVELDNGETVWFRDQNSLATLFFTTDISVLQDKLKSLGPDIMTREFSLPLFKSLAVKHGNSNVTNFLTNQSIISGCGNYIKSETLWYASISPMRKVVNISVRELELLYEGLRIISRVSYNNKGLTMGGLEQEGYYSNELNIYGKKTAKLTKTSDGNITYWDPNRQV